jgi:hypothetical protein
MVDLVLDFDVLEIRRRLGRDRWGPPRVDLGPVMMMRSDGKRSIGLSSAPFEDDGTIWLHASIAAHPDDAPVPSYDELVMLRAAVWGERGWAFQVFAPPAHHINIRANALHLWGRLDGERTHPDFGFAGTI